MQLRLTVYLARVEVDHCLGAKRTHSRVRAKLGDGQTLRPGPSDPQAQCGRLTQQQRQRDRQVLGGQQGGLEPKPGGLFDQGQIEARPKASETRGSHVELAGPGLGGSSTSQPQIQISRSGMAGQGGQQTTALRAREIQLEDGVVEPEASDRLDARAGLIQPHQLQVQCQ